MELVYKTLLIFVIFQRVYELKLAKSNEACIIAQGGKVLKEKNYFFMVLLHTLWLLSLVYYTFFKDNIFEADLFYPFLVLFLIGQSLRIVAIKTLGRRWSTRVVVLPKAPVIKTGLFDYIRHPNYLGVILEIFSLPLMAGLWPIAFIFSILNGAILAFRIPFEEKMLSEYNDYQEKFHMKAKT